MCRNHERPEVLERATRCNSVIRPSCTSEIDQLKALLKLRAGDHHSDKVLGTPVLPQDATEVLKH